MSEVSLEDFVFETLMAISKGVARAQDSSRREGAIPIALFSVAGEQVKNGEQLVQFSVSLQADGKQSIAGAGEAKGSLISVVTGKVAVDGRTEKIDSRLHSVQFSVPMHFNSRYSKEVK